MVRQVGLALDLISVTGFLRFADQGTLLLLVFSMLTGLMESLKMSGARGPLLQNIILPELRATGRSAIDIVIGLASALAYALSGPLVQAFRNSVVGMMLILILIPIARLLTTVAWIPMFRTYPKTWLAQSAALARRRDEIVEAR